MKKWSAKEKRYENETKITWSRGGRLSKGGCAREIKRTKANEKKVEKVKVVLSRFKFGEGEQGLQYHEV